MKNNEKDTLTDQIKALERETHLTVIDLFSGVGGFSLGAARAGFQILSAVDNEPRASKAFAVNFHGSKHLQEDIVKLTGARLRQAACIEKRTVHGVIGGPPCQGFSRIGHRAPNDPRNLLFDHFFRLVSEIRPWFYVAENVQGILDSPFQDLVAKAVSQLQDYRHLPPLILKSSDFGAPTSRQRILFIGYKPKYFNELNAADFKAGDRSENVTVEMALQGLPRKIDPNWQKEPEGWRCLTKRHRGLFWDRIYGEVPPGIGDPHSLRRLNTEGRVSGCLGTNHTEKVVKRFASVEEGDVDGPSRAVRLERKGFCPTLRAGTGPERGSFQALRPIHPTEPRVITPREAARLQGFPDWFLFDATKWHSFRQIGNSVSPILAEHIMRIIADHMHGGKP